MPLIQGRSAEEVHALVLAAARLLLRMPITISPLLESWLAELQGVGLRPDMLTPHRRDQAERAVQEIQELPPGALEAALPLYLSSAERCAERRAWAETGDLLAALRALGGPLKRPALSELVAFADRQLL